MRVARAPRRCVGLVVGIVLGLVWPAWGAVIYVDDGAGGDGDGGSWEAAFSELQDALAVAVPGDEIWVARGVYTPGAVGERGRSFVLLSGVGVYGGFFGNETARAQRDWVAHPTVLSGDLMGNDEPEPDASWDDNVWHVVVASGAGRTAVLDGFVITAGHVSGRNPTECLGIHCSAGAGIHNDGGSPTIANCHVVNNHASSGGGIYNGPGSDLLLINTTVELNDRSGLYGEYSRVHMVGCRVLDNRNSRGGGIQVSRSIVLLDRCELAGNVAWGDVASTGGAAILAYFSTLELNSCLLHHNVAEGGPGGAITTITSEVTLTHCTVANNDGNAPGRGLRGGLDSQVVVTNSVLWGNGDSESAQLAFDDETVTYSCVQGLDTHAAAVGNTGSDPLFAHPASGDYGLGSGSPLIDAAQNAALCHTRDHAANPRRLDDPATVDTGQGRAPIGDMGALEFVPMACAADPESCAVPEEDCNGDDRIDTCQLEGLGTVAAARIPLSSQAYGDHQFESLPAAASDVTLSVFIRAVTFFPIAVRINNTPAGSFFGTPIDACFLSAGPVDSVIPRDAFNAMVPTGAAVLRIATGLVDLESCPDSEVLMILRYVPTSDCDDNGALDECDIAAGSTDCNGNGRPDGCEPTNDCDVSGVQDICEIAADPAVDLNLNALLDTCESCVARDDCADLDGDGIRDSNCVWWSCTAGSCTGMPIPFADMGGQFGACAPDGTADSNDRFHALNCFADQNADGTAPYDCEDASPVAYNVDAGGPFGACVSDGVCDGNDAFHALNAFSGESACSCLPVGAAPMPTVVRPASSRRAELGLMPGRNQVQPGETIDVQVYLHTRIEDLRGYQLHLAATGGTRGNLELVDISIDDRRDAAFATATPWSAFNTSTRQMMAGLDTPGVHAPAGSYLATFSFQASDDAVGRFAIDLLADPGDNTQRTYLFYTDARVVTHIKTEPVIVEIVAARKRHARR